MQPSESPVPSEHPQPDSRLQRIRTVGYLLDDAIRIPIIGYRIGWDAVIGLVPGIGDVAGLVLAAYLVLEASRFGLPVATLVRMVFNIVLEAIIGAIPALGDLFDATWKANRRNVALLEAHLQETGARQRTADRRFVFAILLILVLILVLMLVALGALFVVGAEMLRRLVVG